MSDVDNAVRTLGDDYRTDVGQVAKELAKNLSDGDYSDDDAFTEALEQEAQGHACTSMPWSCYTLAFSSNREAWKDVYGKVSELGDDADAVVNGMAYWAFRQDVYEELSSNHGIESGSAVSDRCDKCWDMKDSCECCSRCEEKSDNCNCCHECESLQEDCSYCVECSSHECSSCNECGNHECKCKKDDEEEEDTPKPKRKPVEPMRVQVLAKEEEPIDNQQETASWYK